MLTSDWSRNAWGRAGTGALRVVCCYYGEERGKEDVGLQPSPVLDNQEAGSSLWTGQLFGIESGLQ